MFLKLLSGAWGWLTSNVRLILGVISIAAVVGGSIAVYSVYQENQRLKVQHGADQVQLQSEHAAVKAAADSIKEWAESAKRLQQSLDAYSERQKQIAETVRSITHDLSGITKRPHTADQAVAEREFNERFNALLGLLRGPADGRSAPGIGASGPHAADPQAR